MVWSRIDLKLSHKLIKKKTYNLNPISRKRLDITKQWVNLRRMMRTEFIIIYIYKNIFLKKKKNSILLTFQ